MARPRTTTAAPPPPLEQRQLPSPRALAVAGIAIVAAVMFVLGRGGGDEHEKVSGCAIGDVSGSTADVHDKYVDAFRDFATDIGTNGSGKVCLIVAAGDPIAEGLPQWANVGPTKEHRGSPDLAPVDIKRGVDAATADVENALTKPEVGVGGSALIEASMVASKVVKPGDKLLWMTDGVQNSPAVGDFTQIDLSDAAIATLLDDLGNRGLLADLNGVQIQMPFLLYHPGGMNMPVERQQQVEKFWVAWAADVGATLVTGSGS